MWASPSNIPTNTSFISLGIVINFLSEEDIRLIPFVERLLVTIKLDNRSCNIFRKFSFTGGLYLHYKVSPIMSHV